MVGHFLEYWSWCTNDSFLQVSDETEYATLAGCGLPERKSNHFPTKPSLIYTKISQLTIETLKTIR